MILDNTQNYIHNYYTVHIKITLIKLINKNNDHCSNSEILTHLPFYQQRNTRVSMATGQ